MVSWLVGWSFGTLVAQSLQWLAGCSVSPTVGGSLVGRLVRQSSGWLDGWLAVQSVSRSVGWLAVWFVLLVGKSVRCLVGQSIGLLVGQSIDCFIGRSVSQSVSGLFAWVRSHYQHYSQKQNLAHPKISTTKKLSFKRKSQNIDIILRSHY